MLPCCGAPVPSSFECPCAGRSMSAAADAIGAYHSAETCSYRQCRARLSAPLQGVCVRRCRPITCQSARRSVSAATFFSRPAVLRSERRYTPYFGAYRLSAAGTGRQCLPEIATGAKRPRNDNLGGIYHFNDSLYGRQVRRRARHASPLLFHTYRSGGQMSFSAEKTGRFSGKKFQKALAFRVFQCYNKDNL